MSKRSMVCAGIDTGRRKLDVALHGRGERLEVPTALMATGRWRRGCVSVAWSGLGSRRTAAHWPRL